MAVDEVADRFGRKQHDADRNDDRDHHDRHLVDHADGCNDRVERENNIDHHDLQQYAAIGRCDRIAITVCALRPLERVMNLMDALPEQKQATTDQDQIAT